MFVDSSIRIFIEGWLIKLLLKHVRVFNMKHIQLELRYDVKVRKIFLFKERKRYDLLQQLSRLSHFFTTFQIDIYLQELFCSRDEPLFITVFVENSELFFTKSYSKAGCSGSIAWNTVRSIWSPELFYSLQTPDYSCRVKTSFFRDKCRETESHLIMIDRKTYPQMLKIT